MDWTRNGHRISDIDTLETLYGKPAANSVVKEVDHVHPSYRAFIEAAPFAVLATAGPGGLDASPRGDAPGFAVVEDEKTLLIPDRRGNNRIDSLRNIIADPRIALIFMIPGLSETLRVNGRATIVNDPALVSRFSMDGKLPRSVLVVHVESVFFQCGRAILRSRLWEAARIDRVAVPTPGAILQELSKSEVDGAKYDSELPERLRTTLY